MLIANIKVAAKNKKFSKNLLANSSCSCGGPSHCSNCGSGACVRIKDKNINLELIYKS